MEDSKDGAKFENGAKGENGAKVENSNQIVSTTLDLEGIKTLNDANNDDKVKDDLYCGDNKNRDKISGDVSEKGLEEIWNIFINFETYTFDPEEISFTKYLTEWQRRLNEVIECGLHYSQTVLSLKLLHNSNLKPDVRSNIFSTINSHLETNILLFTLCALNDIKTEDYEKEKIKVENEDCKKSKINIATDDHSEHNHHEHTDNQHFKHHESEHDEYLEDIDDHLEDHEINDHSDNFEQNTDISFCKDSELDDHELVGNDESRVKCDICDKIFFSDKVLKLHKKSVHKKHLSCDYCDKLFDRQSKLTKHMETHAKRLAATQGLFQCDQCGKEMQGKKRLRIHKRTHFQFRCQPCNKIFKDKDLLNRHVLNHREFGCIQCGLVFYQQALLVKHMNTITHGGERKFACDLCGKTFMKKYNLQTHQLTHTGEKKFRCDFQDCAMAFYKKDVMIRHMRIHTGEKPYQCDVCQRRFTQSGDLRKHGRTHASDKNSL